MLRNFSFTRVFFLTPSFFYQVIKMAASSFRLETETETKFRLPYIRRDATRRVISSTATWPSIRACTRSYEYLKYRRIRVSAIRILIYVNLRTHTRTRTVQPPNKVPNGLPNTYITAPRTLQLRHSSQLTTTLKGR